MSNASADVCVIGAGIAGLTTAYLLLKKGRSVVVLDDGEIAGGETERTTAHIVTALDDRYHWLEKVHGKKRTRLAAESHVAAIDCIEEIVRDEKIDCDFERVSGYLFLPPGDSDDMLKKELEATRRVGLRDVELIPKLDLTGTAALHFPQQGQFHILKYMRGLAEAIVSGGGKIHAKTHVKNFTADGECVTEVDGGHSVKSGAIVIATNAPIHDNVQIYAKQAAYRTYVIAGIIDKGSMKKALYWDTFESQTSLRPIPYHYIRIQESKDHDFLVIGGEDHKTGQANDAELRFANLERWSRAKFPNMKDVAYRWSGQVMETYDGLAFIGHMPMAGKNVFIATGDSGNGMTHGTIAGMLLSDRICEKENPWEDIYNPSRIRLRAGQEFLSESANVAVKVVKGMLPQHGPDEKNLGPGKGAVLSQGKEKIALYIDDDGTKHEFSAVCPHKGCIVQWNSFERSFDCPCHGSRFACDGTALNGPTIGGLEPVGKKKGKKS